MYHFMFGPEYTGGCPACSAIADGFNGFAVHLENHDVAMIAVSRAPIAALQAYKRRMGWTFTWVSSLNSDFNYDFNTSFTEEQQRSGNVYYNYRTLNTGPRSEVPLGGDLESLDIAAEHAAMTGTDVPTYTREGPGVSAFALSDGFVYHTYSTYARGLDVLWGCISGSTGRLRGVTKLGPGSSGMMNTCKVPRQRSLPKAYSYVVLAKAYL
jgi:predicted dithiol-disulfide oxidoreductase (DUF899 family)